MRAVRKPPARPSGVFDQLRAATVEEMRALLLADGRQRDAALVCVLAYAGLRPGGRSRSDGATCGSARC